MPPQNDKKRTSKIDAKKYEKKPRTEPNWTPKGIQKETKNPYENGAEKETQKRGENKPGYHGTGSEISASSWTCEKLGGNVCF